MSTQDQQRLLEQTGPASDLLKKAQPLDEPMLSQAAFVRIEARLLEETTAPRPRGGIIPWPWLVPALAAAGMVAGLLLWNGGKTPVPIENPVATTLPAPKVAIPKDTLPKEAPKDTSTEVVSIEAGQKSLRLSEGGELLFEGPTEATVTARKVTLHKGLVRIKSGEEDVVVLLPEGKVVVKKGSASSVEIHQRQGVKVASYQGTAQVEFRSQEQEVHTGEVWTSSSLLTKDGVPPRKLSPKPPSKASSLQVDLPQEPSPEVQPPPKEAGKAGKKPDENQALRAESELLGNALRALRQDHDPKAALALLLRYESRFPKGTLAPEAAAAKQDALLALAENAASHKNCTGAIPSFTLALSTLSEPAKIERALYGRAVCHANQGNRTQAEADLKEYLRRFPGGKYSDEARDALGR